MFHVSRFLKNQSDKAECDQAHIIGGDDWNNMFKPKIRSGQGTDILLLRSLNSHNTHCI